MASCWSGPCAAGRGHRRGSRQQHRCRPPAHEPRATSTLRSESRPRFTSRTAAFILGDMAVLIWGLIGVALLITKATVIGGVICLAVAAGKVNRLLSHDDLDDRLRLREEKRQHGIMRLLRESEREEILAVDRYAGELEAMGANPSLVRQVRGQAWKIVKQAGQQDATVPLRTYRLGLPTIAEPMEQESGSSDLRGDIERELQVLRATQRELDSL